MIKERRCSYEVAKLLKEKGFRECCRCCYGTTVRHNGEDIDEDEEFELKSEGRAAIAAMQELLEHSGDAYTESYIARTALIYADALVERMKGEWI